MSLADCSAHGPNTKLLIWFLNMMALLTIRCTRVARAGTLRTMELEKTRPIR